MSSQMKIARLAQVSQSVVSRVLNGRAKEFGIADDTVSRVRLIADALKYRPNQAANMLLGRQTKLIGVIVRSFEDQFLTHILQELNKRALQAGYMLLVVGFEHGVFNAEEIQLLRGYRPDAFLVVGSTDFRQWDAEFLDCGKLILQIGLPVDDSRVISCSTDEEAAAQLLIDHLVELGHKSFGLIGDNVASGRWRTNHLKAALQDRGLHVSLPCVFVAEGDAAAAGVEAAVHFLDPSVRASWPTAVIATSDLTALAFIRRLWENGVEVPSALSVASYDDIEFAALARPSLTTVQQPVRSLAATSMEMITGARVQASIVLPPLLQVRESTAAAPGG
jgi:LacI family transcriptional regulator